MLHLQSIKIIAQPVPLKRKKNQQKMANNPEEHRHPHCKFAKSYRKHDPISTTMCLHDQVGIDFINSSAIGCGLRRNDSCMNHCDKNHSRQPKGWPLHCSPPHDQGTRGIVSQKGCVRGLDSHESLQMWGLMRIYASFRLHLNQHVPEVEGLHDCFTGRCQWRGQRRSLVSRNTLIQW